MSYSLPEVTLKERIHPKLWLAEFHSTSAWHGKRLYTLLLSAVCLLDMKGSELFHWKFQDDFLWEILRTLVSYDWSPVIIVCTCQVRYIWSLCGTEDLINKLILDGLLWLRWRFFEAYILVGTMLFVCWFVVLLFPLVYLPQFINVTSLLLYGFFYNLTAFFISMFFLAYRNVGCTSLYIFRMSLFLTPIISATCFDCVFSGLK